MKRIQLMASREALRDGSTTPNLKDLVYIWEGMMMPKGLCSNN